MVTTKGLGFLLMGIAIALLFSIPASAVVNASLQFGNLTRIDFLRYDRVGTLLGHAVGSDSYMDQSPANANLLLSLCAPNVSVGQEVDLVYASESGNITESVLNFRPRITSVTSGVDANGSFSCADIDVDIASRKALYPGHLTPLIYDAPTYNQAQWNFPRIAQALNGTYRAGVVVVGPPKTFYLKISTMLDHAGANIVRDEPFLIMSVVNGTSTVTLEQRLQFGDTVLYSHGFTGGERVFVNGILALQVLLVDPCDPITEAGYYVLNGSQFNLNETCLVINQTNDVVVNFGGELIDGDNSSMGSMRDDMCGIIIQDSLNVTFEEMFVQQFYHGVCVINSSAGMFGSAAVYNVNGAYLIEASQTRMADVIISNNNDTELRSRNFSITELINVTFTTANMKSEFRDVTIKSVLNEPSPPSINGILDIDQYIEYNKASNESWAIMRFYYPDTIPNGVAIDNVSLYKFNGTFAGSNGSNSSGWTGNWTTVFTLISPSEQLIIGPNTTNFSVWAPFGFVEQSNATPPPPVPDPTPQPVSSPSAGGGGGGGSTPRRTDQPDLTQFPENIEFRLILPPNLTVQQGEAGDVLFNLSNIGEAHAPNITIGVIVPPGWESTNWTYPWLARGESVDGSFQIAPYEKAIPQTYQIPVRVYVRAAGEERVIMTELLKVIVLPRGNLRRIRAIEYPPIIQISPNGKQEVSFLMANIGDSDLANITIIYEPNDCLKNITGSNDIKQGATKLFLHTFYAKGDQKTCDYNLKFFEREQLVGFIPVSFVIKPSSIWAQPIKLIILLLILALWTALTVSIASRRRLKR